MHGDSMDATDINEINSYSIKESIMKGLLTKYSNSDKNIIIRYKMKASAIPLTIERFEAKLPDFMRLNSDYIVCLEQYSLHPIVLKKKDSSLEPVLDAWKQRYLAQ